MGIYDKHFSRHHTRVWHRHHFSVLISVLQSDFRDLFRELRLCDARIIGVDSFWFSINTAWTFCWLWAKMSIRFKRGVEMKPTSAVSWWAVSLSRQSPSPKVMEFVGSVCEVFCKRRVQTKQWSILHFNGMMKNNLILEWHSNHLLNGKSCRVQKMYLLNFLQVSPYNLYNQNELINLESTEVMFI